VALLQRDSPGGVMYAGCFCYIDSAADVQCVPGGRGEPRLPAAESVPYQRSRGAPRLLGRRRRRLQLVQLRQADAPPVHATASTVSAADERRNDGRIRLGLAEFGPTEAILSAGLHPVERPHSRTGPLRFYT